MHYLSLAIGAVAYLSFASSASAQKAPPQSPQMVATCNKKDDAIRVLKLADREQVYVTLKNDAKVTANAQCLKKTEELGGHLVKILKATMSADANEICVVLSQPVTQQAVMDTLKTAYKMYAVTPCDVF